MDKKQAIEILQAHIFDLNEMEKFRGKAALRKEIESVKKLLLKYKFGEKNTLLLLREIESKIVGYKGVNAVNLES